MKTNLKYEFYVYLVTGIIILIHLLWVFSIRIFPFIDLPFHLAEAHIIKHFDESSNLFKEFYSIPHFTKSNIFYIYFISSGIFGKVETGNRIFLSIYVIFFMFSFIYSIKKFNGELLFTLLSVIILMNHNVHWGFVGYIFAFPLIIVSTVYFKGIFISGNKYLCLLSAPYIIFIFLCHFQSALFVTLLFFILAIVYFRKTEISQKILILLSITISSIIMMFIYFIDSTDTKYQLAEYLFNYYKSEYLVSLIDRFKNFFIIDSFYLFEGVAGWIFSLLITSVIIIVFIISYIKRKRIKDDSKNLLYIFLITSILCYFILPDNIQGQNIIYERFSIIIKAGLIILSSILAVPKSRKFIKIMFTIIALIYSAVIIGYMYEFNSACEDFNQDIFPDNSYATIGSIISDNNFKGRPIYTHFHNYYTIWKSGISIGIVDYRFGYLRRTNKSVHFPIFEEWKDENYIYKGEYSKLDYLLVRNSIQTNLQGFEMKINRGKWFLYANKTNNPY